MFLSHFHTLRLQSHSSWISKSVLFNAKQSILKPSSFYSTSSTSKEAIENPQLLHLPKYGGRYLVTLIPGDGIGREVCNAVKNIFNYLKVPIDFEEIPISGHLNASAGVNDHLQNAIDSLKRTKVGLKGILYTPMTGPSSYNVAIRKNLDIFANVVPVKSMPKGVPSRFSNVDFFIIRENTEGEYSGLEHQSIPGVIESLKVTTREKSERIIRFAFDWAMRHGRKKITCVHKANIMKLTDGLFLKIFRQEALAYKSTGLLFDDMIVDNTAMQLVSRPHQFDVIVTPNLYGNICANIGAGLVGGPGLLPGLNIGRDICTFEPGARHVAMDIMDRNCANPTSMILSSCWMLRHLGLNEYANLIEDATNTVLSEGKTLTVDLGGSATTTEFSDAVIKKLAIS